VKAIRWTAYGEPEVLRLMSVDKPRPNSAEVLIKVHATTVTVGDCRLRSLRVPRGMEFATRLVFGITKPRCLIPGMHFSGEVTEVGSQVNGFKVGDRVFGSTGMKLGANAEYVCMAADKEMVGIPDTLSHEDAVSLIFGGLTALYFLRDKVNIKHGEHVLINGGSGSVGSAAIQIAKYYGATVSAICSANNQSLVRSLGADDVIDYTKKDFSEKHGKYDVILDTVGNFSFAHCQKLMTKTGRAILINVGIGTLLRSIFTKKLICGTASETKEALYFLLKLVQTGKFVPVIDRVYPLEGIRDAHSYVDSGRKKGNIVISLVDNIPQVS